MTPKPADLLRIRQLPLLETTSPETFGSLCAQALVKSFARGAQLTVEGERDAFLHVLIEGGVEMRSSWDGRGSTLVLLKPPSVFALAPIILDTPALTTVRTIMRSRLLLIPGQSFRQAVRLDPGLALAVTEELSNCYSGVVRELKNHKLRGGLERLANYLLKQRRRQGDGVAVQLPCRKRVLASLLGMTPENLSRAFAQLGAYGVKVDGGLVTLSWPDALAQLAKPDDAEAGRAVFRTGRERGDL